MKKSTALLPFLAVSLYFEKSTAGTTGTRISRRTGGEGRLLNDDHNDGG